MNEVEKLASLILKKRKKTQKFSALEAESKLEKNGVKVENKIIYLNGRNVGLKLLGAVDFLCHYCGYRISFNNDKPISIELERLGVK
jgi:hypothetical protein